MPSTICHVTGYISLYTDSSSFVSLCPLLKVSLPDGVPRAGFVGVGPTIGSFASCRHHGQGALSTGLARFGLPRDAERYGSVGNVAECCMLCVLREEYQHAQAYTHTPRNIPQQP